MVGEATDLKRSCIKNVSNMWARGNGITPKMLMAIAAAKAAKTHAL